MFRIKDRRYPQFCTSQKVPSSGRSACLVMTHPVQGVLPTAQLHTTTVSTNKLEKHIVEQELKGNAVNKETKTVLVEHANQSVFIAERCAPTASIHKHRRSTITDQVSLDWEKARIRSEVSVQLEKSVL